MVLSTFVFFENFAWNGCYCVYIRLLVSFSFKSPSLFCHCPLTSKQVRSNRAQFSLSEFLETKENFLREKMVKIKKIKTLFYTCRDSCVCFLAILWTESAITTGLMDFMCFRYATIEFIWKFLQSYQSSGAHYAKNHRIYTWIQHKCTRNVQVASANSFIPQ